MTQILKKAACDNVSVLKSRMFQRDKEQEEKWDSSGSEVRFFE